MPALLVDGVFVEAPVQQWVLSVPYALRFLFATRLAIMGEVLGIVYRVIAMHMVSRAGFSVHASVAAWANERDKLERLCRYVSRPAVSEQRLSLTSNGNVRYQLKTPYRDGTTHVVFEPLDLLARLAALVPRPRVNLTRYHGVFVPNTRHRAMVTKAGRGSRGPSDNQAGARPGDRTPAERGASMRWAQPLRQVFRIDTRSLVDVASLPDGVEQTGYVDSWKRKAPASV